MSFDYGALDAALTAAVGDDQLLIAELRAAFLESARRQVDLLSRARLKGLAASFSATKILHLADEAAHSAPGDPVILRKLQRAVSEVEVHRD